MNDTNVTAFPIAAETESAAPVSDAGPATTVEQAPEPVALDPSPALDASSEPLNEAEYATKADLLLLQNRVGEFHTTAIQTFALMDKKIADVDATRQDHLKVLSDRIDQLAVADQARERLKKGDPTGYRPR